MTQLISFRLKDKALSLGFAALGISSAEPLIEAEQAIKNRVESGLLKNYGFARRPAHHFTRPEKLLSGARSIISAAFPYPPPAQEGRAGGLYGRIAAFALGRDYHLELTERLSELGRWLSCETGGAAFRVCVDTGPMIDRAVARRAGVGSYGKNASIILPNAGSWVMLGELITDFELQPDEPAPMELCGDCDICIRSCPTQAIVQPFVVDQTRCISHLTQMKGVIPEEFRTLINDRIYGCDVCQAVCPRNRDITTLPTTQTHTPWVDPAWLLQMDEGTFSRAFGESAMAWVGRGTIRRNAAVVMGNASDSSMISALAEAVKDADTVVAEHAEWAISQIKERERR